MTNCSSRFSDQFKADYPHVKQEWMQTLLRVKQWIVPNYALPPDADKIEILRVVVRETVSVELIHKLVEDIVEAAESLMSMSSISRMWCDVLIMCCCAQTKEMKLSCSQPSPHLSIPSRMTAFNRLTPSLAKSPHVDPIPFCRFKLNKSLLDSPEIYARQRMLQNVVHSMRVS